MSGTIESKVISPSGSAAVAGTSVTSIGVTSGYVLEANGDGTCSWEAVSGTGTVTTVNTDSTTSSIFANTTNVIGTTTVTLTLSSQAANKFLAGPASSTAAPTFRVIAAGDVPTLNQNTTGTAANVTASSNTSLTSLANLVTVGTIGTGTWQGTPVTPAYGGTGLSTLTAYAVLCGGTTSTGTLQQVSGLGTSGYVLTSNGASALPSWQAGSGGSGVTTVGTFSGSSQTNGASISSTTITFGPADGTNPGMLKASGNQTIGCNPTFTGSGGATFTEGVALTTYGIGPSAGYSTSKPIFETDTNGFTGIGSSAAGIVSIFTANSGGTTANDIIDFAGSSANSGGASTITLRGQGSGRILASVSDNTWQLGQSAGAFTGLYSYQVQNSDNSGSTAGGALTVRAGNSSGSGAGGILTLLAGTSSSGTAGMINAGAAAPAAGATGGFLCAPVGTATPTGAPSPTSGYAPFYFTNVSGVYALYAYLNGGWHSVALI